MTRSNQPCQFQKDGLFGQRSEDVTVGKPDPQVFLVAASRLDVPPSQCLVVEDAAAGVEAARRAGMLSVGVRAKGDTLQANVFTRSMVKLDDTAFDRLLGER